MSRQDAAARAIAEQDRRRVNTFHQAQARDALAAADVHDAANGVHRVTADDETAERVAKALATHKWPTAIGLWDSFGQSVKDDFRDQARAALAAAVKEGP